MNTYAIAILAGLRLAQAESQFHPRYQGGQLHVDIQRKRGDGTWESLRKRSKLCTGDQLQIFLSAEPKQWVRLYTQDRQQPGGAGYERAFQEVGPAPLRFPTSAPSLTVLASAEGDKQEHFVFLVADGRPDESHHCAAVAAVGGSCEAARSDGPRYRQVGVFLQDLPSPPDAPAATKVGLLTIVLEHPESCH